MSQRLMRECPKYPSCSAPLCPLDADWKLRVGNAGEPMCYYFLEHSKDGSWTRFSGSHTEDIFAACTEMLSDPLLPAWATAAHRRASTSGSRWDSGKKLRAAQLAKKAAA